MQHLHIISDSFLFSVVLVAAVALSPPAALLAAQLAARAGGGVSSSGGGCSYGRKWLDMDKELCRDCWTLSTLHNIWSFSLKARNRCTPCAKWDTLSSWSRSTLVDVATRGGVWHAATLMMLPHPVTRKHWTRPDRARHLGCCHDCSGGFFFSRGGVPQLGSW